MPGYHEVEGIPVHASKWLLTDVLRKEWGFKGYVFSDYGVIGMLDQFHRTSHNKTESAVQAFTAGVDLEAPGRYAYGELVHLVQDGTIPAAMVDSSVARVLRIKFKLGLFDRPFRYNAQQARKIIHRKDHIEPSQRITEESIVLLKNEEQLLQLSKKNLKRIAVIGPNSDKVQFGDYSVTKSNEYGVTVLEGIRNYVGNQVEVKYTEGCGITGLSKDGFDEAERLARESDVVILVLGGTSSMISGIGWGDPNSKEANTCGEGFDRNELNFPGVQAEWLDRVSQQGKPVVLVMLNGRPYTIADEIKKVHAALEAWYPGEKGMCNNLVYRCKSSGFHQHYGKENKIENNILAFGHYYQVQYTRPEKHISFSFRHNIILQNKGKTFHGNGWDKGNLDMDYNLLWHVDGQPEFGKMTFEEWKKARGGQHSVIMDPMFEDAEHDNYHFRSLKAAKKIGFKVFDTSIVGVYGSDSWKKKAEMSPELIEKFQAAAKVRLAK